jgi:hypothetical protein
MKIGCNFKSTNDATKASVDHYQVIMVAESIGDVIPALWRPLADGFESLTRKLPITFQRLHLISVYGPATTNWVSLIDW